MRPLLTALRWDLRDKLARTLPPLASTFSYLASSCTETVASALSWRLLLASSRYRPSPNSTRAIARRLSSSSESAHLFSLQDDVELEEAAKRSIVLLAPTVCATGVSRGVLLIKFSQVSRFYLNRVNVEELQRYFAVVLEPSWAGYAVPEILGWTTAPDPVVVQASEVSDRELLRILNTNLHAVPFGASDWVDHRLFRPLDSPNVAYDVAYVASYRPGKRVHAFLRAVREVRAHDPNFRALLVCSRWGGRRSEITSLITHFRLSNVVTLVEDASPRQVCDLLNKSRCNVLLSLKEGSNRSLFEAMFCDCPVIALRSNVGVNKQYINGQTGLLISGNELAGAMLDIKEGRYHFAPRDWAMAHIAPEITTEKLATKLNELFPQQPRPFRNLRVKVNAPEVRYMDRTMPSDHTDLSRTVLQTFLRTERSPDRFERLVAELSAAFTTV